MIDPLDHPCLRELRELLAAFVERPLPGTLVLGHRDEEMLHIVHAFDTLDSNSPADRFLLHFEPFITTRSYVAQLVAHVTAVTSSAPIPEGEPLARLNSLFAAQLAALPQGDHRLVVALLPRRIGDATQFTALAAALLATQHAHQLRLILRDDLAAPLHLLAAMENPSEQVLGYRFHLPATALLEASSAAAHAPDAPPDLRAQALLQRATLSLSSGRFAEAVSATEAALALTKNPVLLALALAFRADALRAMGKHESAVLSARASLQHAASCGSVPVIHHAARTLGELSNELGNTRDATACFALAERTAPHPPGQEIGSPHKETKCPC